MKICDSDTFIERYELMRNGWRTTSERSRRGGGGGLYRIRDQGTKIVRRRTAQSAMSTHMREANGVEVDKSIADSATMFPSSLPSSSCSSSPSLSLLDAERKSLDH